jgi:hypothetical protein
MIVRGKKNDSYNRMKHGTWRPVHNNIIFIHVDNWKREVVYLLEDKSLVRILGNNSCILVFWNSKEYM